MQFKYPFKVINNDKIPLIDILITNKETNKTTSYRAMLDSGAFTNIFHSDIAKVLGIDLARIKETQLFGGVEKSKRQMAGKLCILELMVVEKGKSHKFDSCVIFSDEISETGFALLGRQGFFDQFDEVCLSYKSNKFYLQKDELS